MGTRLRSWWQQIKEHWGAILVVAIILVITLALIIVGYKFDWTGFNGNSKSGKTLWDWMQLLFIPVVLAVAGFWFNQIQKDRDKKAEEAQKQREEDAAREREELERESREDNQRETALQAYIDKMSELLLKEGLRESQPEEEVRKIARVRTLTVLPRLDTIRKRSLLQFLYESNLIDKDNAIIDTSGADLDFIRLFKPKEDEDFPRRIGDNLSGANLHKADLFRADLRRVDLRESNLSDADLRLADLRMANLSNADFSGADLRGVSLCDYLLIEVNREDAHLQEADLSETELSRADLSGIDLSNADLYDAVVTDEQLAKAKSLKGATMPDGSIHP